MADFVTLVLAFSVATCGISHKKTYEPAIILEEVGAVYHPIGKLITSQDRLFIHIAIPRPTHWTIPGRMSLETDCGLPGDLTLDRAMILYMRDMCMEFYNAIMIYNTTATLINDNIDNKLVDINVSLDSITKIDHTISIHKKSPKRFITAVIGLIKGAVDIGMSIHTNR
jgi:hypothetical protein